MNNELPVLVEVWRGPIVESRHRGAIVAVEPDGQILARLGDENLTTSTRSTIKPIQAIPLITSGAADRFNLSPRELAVVCASHDGQPIHTETVAEMLDRAGLDEGALRCGAHPPFNEEAAKELERGGQAPTQLHNNCSGKHAGMLLTASHRGIPVEDYLSSDSAVQRDILAVFSGLAGLNENLPTGLDGCSAPTYGVPLYALALAFARLVNPWLSPTPADKVTEAAKRVVAAMTAHPEMVGGTDKVFDTELMRTARGSLISKVGAESVYSIGVLPCQRFPRGLGIALKVEDGAARARHPAVVETLAQLGLLDQAQQTELEGFHRPEVKNYRETTVGELRPAFDLCLERKPR